MTALALARTHERSSWPVSWSGAIVLLVLLGLAMSSLYPSGLIGGGADDGHYLEAVRCVVANGYCVPDDHWGARAPVVLPTAFAIRLLGESVASLLLFPFLYATGALVFFVLLVRRASGERAAFVAALVLLSTPVFLGRWQRLNADVAELCFLLAGLWLLVRGIDRGRPGPILAAGAAFALAVLSRTSALAVAPLVVAGLLFFDRTPSRRLMMLGCGAVAIFGVEALLHAVTAEQPLLSWQLAHAHTRIPSSELAATLDLSRSPILNPDYIANWRRQEGIRVHWLLDGGLNLLASPAIGWSLILGGLLGLPMLNRSGRTETRWLSPTLGRFLAVAAIVHFSLLTYVLAVHPTPRMFLPILCVAAYSVGLWAARDRSRGGRVVIAVVLVLLLGRAAVIGMRLPDQASYRTIAEAWAARGRPMAIGDNARSVFALSPTLSALPRSERAPSLPVLHYGNKCRGETETLRTFVHRPEWPGPLPIDHVLGPRPHGRMLCVKAPAKADPAAPIHD